MKILKQLPPTAKEYFDFYHHRAVTELIGKGDIEKILQELRTAYKTYPEDKNRISKMAGVLKTGVNAPLPKRLSKPTLAQNVKASLL